MFIDICKEFSINNHQIDVNKLDEDLLKNILI